MGQVYEFKRACEFKIVTAEGLNGESRSPRARSPRESCGNHRICVLWIAGLAVGPNTCVLHLDEAGGWRMTRPFPSVNIPYEKIRALMERAAQSATETALQTALKEGLTWLTRHICEVRTAEAWNRVRRRIEDRLRKDETFLQALATLLGLEPKLSR